MKPYLVINFVSVVNVMIWVYLVFIKVTMSTGCFEICNHIGNYWLLEIDVLDLVPYFSWWQKYFKIIIISCKGAALILDRLLIGASILLVLSPCIALVISVCSLFVTTCSLVWRDIINPSWCGSLNFRLCISVCIGGSHVYIMASPLLIFLHILDRPPCPHIVLNIGWWSSNP